MTMKTLRGRVLVAWLAAAVVALAAGPSGAAVYQVSPAGDDAGQGTAAAPWKTLAYALNAVQPGDAVELAEGSYDFAAPKKPFEGRVVTIRAAKGAEGKVTVGRLNGKYSFIRFEGLIIPESVQIRNAQWVQFLRCHFAPTTKQYFWGTSFPSGEHCGLYGCKVDLLSGAQVSLGGTFQEYRFNEVTNGASDAFNGGGDGILIEGNWVHDMHPVPGAHPDGIQLCNTKNLTVRGNVFDTWNMQTFFFGWSATQTIYAGIVLENNVCTTGPVHGLSTSPSSDMKVRNNLFICDPKYPAGSESINLANMHGKLTVENNIFWQLGVAGLETRSGDVIKNNIFMQKNWKYGTPGEGAILSTTSACFVDRAARDYRPKEGSPAIGKAAPGTTPETDILGRKRPKEKPSIGPIEPQKDDKPFMEMWQTYFAKMQKEVVPPDPPPGAGKTEEKPAAKSGEAAKG